MSLYNSCITLASVAVPSDAPFISLPVLSLSVINANTFSGVFAPFCKCVSKLK